MILTDSQKADLVRLASGDVDPRTRERVDALVSSDPEAARFLAGAKRQCELLSAAFSEACSAAPEEPLSTEQAAAIAGRITQRVRAHQRRRVWRRTLSIAAVIALIITPLAGWQIWRYRPMGRAITLQTGFTAGTGLNRAEFTVRRGSQIDTQTQSGALKLNGSRIAAAPKTRVEFTDMLILKSGQIYVTGPDQIQLKAGDLLLAVQGGALVSAVGNKVVCNVLEGTADVTAGGRVFHVPAGMELVVTPQERTMHKLPRALPHWASQALSALDIPSE